MFDSFSMIPLFLKNKSVYQEWQSLLMTSGIERFSQEDIATLERTYGIYQDETLVATISYSGYLIKYLAILEDYREEGKTFNRLVSQVLADLAQLGRFHSFVVTKPKYRKSFEYLGFKTLAQTSRVVFLEYGMPNIHSFLENIPKKEGRKAAIVMNANPFTKGHQYLIETASKENDWVYVFLLQKEQKWFSTSERLAMLKSGTAHLNNITIVLGDFYVISPFTFPTYFLRENDEISQIQAELDASVFKEMIANNLDITHRYVGEEPLSPMTQMYNRTLKTVLEPEIKIHMLPRIVDDFGEVISATKVRQAYETQQLESVSSMLPTTTKQYLEALIRSKGVNRNGN